MTEKSIELKAMSDEEELYDSFFTKRASRMAPINIWEEFTIKHPKEASSEALKSTREAFEKENNKISDLTKKIQQSAKEKYTIAEELKQKSWRKWVSFYRKNIKPNTPAKDLFKKFLKAKNSQIQSGKTNESFLQSIGIDANFESFKENLRPSN